MKYKILDGNLYTLRRAKSKIAIELTIFSNSAETAPYIYTNKINKKILKLLYIARGFNEQIFVDYHFPSKNGKKHAANSDYYNFFTLKYIYDCSGIEDS